MRNLSAVWNEMFLEERCRLVRLLIARMQLKDDGIDIEWQPAGGSALMGVGGALARGFFWQELLDSGQVSNIAEMAKHEGVEKVRVQKMLRLARLAPDLVEDITREQQAVGVSLEFFMRNPIPDDWKNAQREAIGALAG